MDWEIKAIMADMLGKRPSYWAVPLKTGYPAKERRREVTSDNRRCGRGGPQGSHQTFFH
jgi:hypothetical protein